LACEFRELLELPKYTAYAKVLQEVDGQQRVWKGKIQTLKLKETTGDFYLQQAAKVRRNVIEAISMENLRRRERIADEIAKRQERWRVRVADEPPATQSESKTGTVNIAQWRERTPFRFRVEDILGLPTEPAVVPEDERRPRILKGSVGHELLRPL
jgi:hypothetical protein